MHVIYADQTQTFDVRGAHMTRLIAPSTGASEIILFHGRLDVGAEAPAHRHNHEELILVLGGKLRLNVDGEMATLAEGDSCVIPPEALHQIVNLSADPCEWIGAMPVSTRFVRPDGSEVIAPPWTV
jgi:quercetin dioxygenase-like cupin family protein